MRMQERLGSLQQQLESKLGSHEAHFALGNKLERSVGEALTAEVRAALERLDAMSARANAAESALSRAESSLASANGVRTPDGVTPAQAEAWINAQEDVHRVNALAKKSEL